MPKKTCSLCDSEYDGSDPLQVGRHRHPEPQTGKQRYDWLSSGLNYKSWVKNTKKGLVWHIESTIYTKIWNEHVIDPEEFAKIINKNFVKDLAEEIASFFYKEEDPAKLVWEKIHDNDNNTAWQARSLLSHDDGRPLYFLLKQVASNNKIQWEERSHAALRGYIAKRWGSIEEAKEFMQDKNYRYLQKAATKNGDA